MILNNDNNNKIFRQFNEHAIIEKSFFLNLSLIAFTIVSKEIMKCVLFLLYCKIFLLTPPSQPKQRVKKYFKTQLSMDSQFLIISLSLTSFLQNFGQYMKYGVFGMKTLCKLPGNWNGNLHWVIPATSEADAFMGPIISINIYQGPIIFAAHYADIKANQRRKLLGKILLSYQRRWNIIGWEEFVILTMKLH